MEYPRYGNGGTRNEGTPEYVVDASVVVKWFSGSEEDVENSARNC
jgi:hypothetical protein